MHPVLVKIGPLYIYSYGVMISIAVCVVAYLMSGSAHIVGMDRSKVVDFLIVVLVSGIAGARILHVAANFSYYAGNPLEIIMLTKGGLAFYGGLVFAVIAGIVYLKAQHIELEKAGDLIAPYAALGQAIGRIGCFLNGCCYGIVVTRFPFAVKFPGEACARFPSQVLAAILLIAVYLLLRVMLEKGWMKGNLFFIYLGLTSFQRFFTEFLRGDVPVIMCGLTLSQILSVGLFIFAIGVLIWRGISRGSLNLR